MASARIPKLSNHQFTNYTRQFFHLHAYYAGSLPMSYKARVGCNGKSRHYLSWRMGLPGGIVSLCIGAEFYYR